MDEQDLVRRAFAAWYRAGGAEQPSGDSRVVEHGGLFYVRLVGAAGTLAVYRIRTVNGQAVLKGMKRWPASIEQQ